MRAAASKSVTATRSALLGSLLLAAVATLGLATSQQGARLTAADAAATVTCPANTTYSPTTGVCVADMGWQ